MNENVVAMPGYSVPVPKGEPVPDVVKILEEELSRAKQGIIRAVGIASVVEDGTLVRMISHDFCGHGCSWDLEVAARRLLTQIQKWSDHDEREE